MLTSLRILRGAVATAALVTASALSAMAQPVFGPTIFTKTAAGPETFTETFAAPAGRFGLWVHNGDDGDRVPSGRISVNGVEVVGEADFRRPVDQFVKPVDLVTGANAMAVTLHGDPGGYITVLILPASMHPDLVVGRLLLPYGTASPDLVLSLKNGSHRFPRSVRVVFFDASGAVVASSERFSIGPRASLSRPVSTFMDRGSWTEGSIEIFYAGPEGARLFGLAALTDAGTAIASVVPLEHAGSRRHQPPLAIRPAR
jgi:hypothetical protein